MDKLEIRKQIIEDLGTQVEELKDLLGEAGFEEVVDELVEDYIEQIKEYGEELEEFVFSEGEES